MKFKNLNKQIRLKGIRSLSTKFFMAFVLLLGLSKGLSAQQVTMEMVWVGSTATTADFDIVLRNTGAVPLAFNGIVLRGNHAVNLLQGGTGTISWNALNNNAVSGWSNWPNLSTALGYTAGTRLLNYSSSNTFFTNATAPTIPTGATGVNIGTFRMTVTGGTWVANSQFGFAWATTAAVIAYVNGAATTSSLATGGTNIIRTVPASQPLNPQAAGPTASVLSGTTSICAGSSTNLNVAITGGTPPFTVIYNDGTTNFTVNSYTSGSNISVSPVSTTSYSLVSVTDANTQSGTGNSGTATVTVNSILTPSFTSISPICSGATLSALPTTSTNGVTGTWSPALNNTSTTTYTFSPTVGQCANTNTLSITVNPNVTPTFTSVADICAGATLSALPTTSNNGITGTWSPALDNTTTTLYTFTPDAGLCATTATLTINVTPNVTPTFNAVAAICLGGSLSALPTTSNNGITGTWSPALDNTTTTLYTFTPTAGLCATSATLTIAVNTTIATPTFNAVADICAGASLSALPTTSTNGITGTWSPALNNASTTTYTFTPTAGQCANSTTLTITVNPVVTPTFNSVAAICAGASLSALPTTSTNGITGTWSPALNNLSTTTYTFTADAGQCANTVTLTITVNPNVTPTFTSVAAICAGGSLSALPTTSTNGITGTWSPALDNLATTTYTFMPTAGQCATTATLAITVNPIVTPTFTSVAAICAGATLSALPTTSNNGVTGTWSPSLDNLATTTYTFTPTAGQCANTATLSITVSPIVTPTFTAVSAICAGGTLSALPTTSNNGITGTWTPALNNAATTTYTFTPTAGQCANTATLSITVNPIVTPTFTSISAICSGATLSALPTTSNNGIAGTWSPALDNMATTTYTFTPTAGQCANTVMLTVTVNSLPVVTATNVSGCLGSSIYLVGSPAGGTFSIANPYTGPSTTYTYTYTDGNGCSATSATASITSNPCAFTVSILLDQPISCNGAANGSVLATATPANPNYEYTIDGGTANAVTNIDGFFYNLDAGIHTICVVDVLNPGVTVCNTIQLIEPDVLTSTFTIDATVSCLGNDGQISVNIVGGTNMNQGYLTWWTNANGDTLNLTNNFQQTIANLPTGVYTIVVEDDHYCFATSTITLGNTPAPQVTASYTAIACYGGTTLITPVATGGTGTKVNTITGGSFTVSVGMYVITSTDAKGCTATTIVTITQPTQVNLGASVTSNYNGSQLSCISTTDGIITASGTGGTVPYTFSIDGGAYQSSPIFTGLAAGTHTISTKDANGCSASSTATITPPPTIVAQAIVTSNYNGAQLSCATSTDGKITASGTGGTGGMANYTYSIDGGTYQSSPIFLGLAAGTHTVATKDINGCTSTATATIAAPTQLVASSVVTSNYNGSQLSCATSTDGKITVSGSGGTGTYTYAKNGGTYQVSPLFLNLAAGTYTMSTKDANGCVSTTTVAITAPSSIVANASVTSNFNGSHISCTASTDGQITASATGGTGTYNYKLNTGSYQASTVFNGLGAGIYTITAKDVNGCSITNTVSIIAPSAIVASAAVTSNYNGAHLSCSSSTDAQITASGTGGTGSYSYRLNLGVYQPSAVFTGLAAGNYTITTKDVNGCSATTTITIVAPSVIVASAVVSSNYNGSQISCTSSTDGQITASGTGGTGSYMYAKNGGTFQSSALFNGLGAGTYTITTMDVNGCSATKTVTIIAPAAIAVSAIVTSNYNGAQTSCTTSADGTITATGTGGTGTKTYSVDGGSYQASTVLTGLAAGTHTISIQDVNGCIATTTATIIAPTAIVAGATVTSNYNGSQLSCSSSTDGIITASGTGGTGTYTYAINGGAYKPSPNFSGLGAGTYTISTKDVNGCVATTTITITAPASIAATATVTSNYNGSQISCTTSTNGELSVNSVGGSGIHTYSINGGVYQSASIFNGLAAGTFTITIKDANGCTGTTTSAIIAPAGIVASAVISTPVACSGNTGFVTISATGGTGTYIGTGIFPVAVGGPYTYNVTDANGCSSNASISISQPATIVGSSSATSCNSYTWVQNGSQVYNGSGSYTHVFTSASGCDSIHTLNVTIINSTSSTTVVNSYLSYTWPANGVVYSTSGVYNTILTNAVGCDSNITLNLTIINGISISPKLILAGAYDASTGLMHDSLRVQQLIPANEPYSNMMYATISEPTIGTLSSSTLAVEGTNAVVDWVFVEIRSASNVNTLLATKRAIVQRDGDVVSTDGISPLFISGLPAGNYYVSVKHRNHLGVMSASPIALSINTTSIDFTSSSFPVYVKTGVSNTPRKVVGSISGLWPGDANANKNVKYNGLMNDKDAILNLVGIATPNNTLYAYRVEDVNLDGKVRYNNADNDKNFIALQFGATINSIISQHTP